MKVLLTGASGILGTDIQSQLELDGHTVLGFNSTNIDIVDYSALKQTVSHFNPDTIIHCAAMTEVDRCEDERELAYAINVTGTENMARLAKELGATLVYISSCGVYGNGKATPYHEMDRTFPLNYHHETKLAGEKKVIDIVHDYLIIRPGWLFGGTPEHKKNFVRARRQEAIDNAVIQSAFDKIGSPTYTRDVAAQIAVLLNKNYKGIFNVVNEGEASRFNYVSEIIRLSNIVCRVEPVNSGLFRRKALMPDNESLENRNLNLKQCNRMRHWKLALKEYIDKTYNDHG